MYKQFFLYVVCSFLCTFIVTSTIVLNKWVQNKHTIERSMTIKYIVIERSDVISVKLKENILLLTLRYKITEQLDKTKYNIICLYNIPVGVVASLAPNGECGIPLKSYEKYMEVMDVLKDK